MSILMRLVRVKVNDGEQERTQQHYRQRIVAALETVLGCRYAGLMKSLHHIEEYVSLTLWDKEEGAEACERIGSFVTRLDETRPLLLESSESRLQLSKDLTLEYIPVAEEPIVRGFPVAEQSGDLCPCGNNAASCRYGSCH